MAVSTVVRRVKSTWPGLFMKTVEIDASRLDKTICGYLA